MAGDIGQWPFVLQDDRSVAGHSAALGRAALLVGRAVAVRVALHDAGLADRQLADEAGWTLARVVNSEGIATHIAGSVMATLIAPWTIGIMDTGVQTTGRWIRPLEWTLPLFSLSAVDVRTALPLNGNQETSMRRSNVRTSISALDHQTVVALGNGTDVVPPHLSMEIESRGYWVVATGFRCSW